MYYANRKLSKAERNYSTTEREALGMVYNITKYRHYMLGHKFSFHVDHSTLIYLVSNASLTDKIARLTLLLHEFEFDIYHRPGVHRAVADYLSWLEFVMSSLTLIYSWLLYNQRQTQPSSRKING